MTPPLDWPNPKLSCLLTAFALLLAPLAVAVFNRVMASARPKRVMKSWPLIAGIAAASLRVERFVADSEARRRYFYYS
jgi:hypothetical protein